MNTTNYESQLKSLITEGMGQKAFEAFLMNPQERRGELFQALADSSFRLQMEIEELTETCVPKDILLAERGGHEERLRDSQEENEKLKKKIDEWYCRCEMAESKASSYDEMKKECVGLRKEIERLKDKHNALLETLAPA
jgi:FtsZ-binding cell division protein ZapB|tara:strand:+ start:2984 stop:3400 length:417 start_codon:yes stop_codon:yes gene_type:complete